MLVYILKDYQGEKRGKPWEYRKGATLNVESTYGRYLINRGVAADATLKMKPRHKDKAIRPIGNKDG